MKGKGCTDREEFIKLGAQTIEKVNEYVERHPGECFLGGDWEWINSINGLMGCSAVYSCPLLSLI